MERMFALALAVLLTTGTGIAGKGAYLASTAASPTPLAAASRASAAAIPAYFKPVPMDAPATPAITIDLPVNGTIYPPDIIPPQFAWRDDNPADTVWRIEIVFGEHARPIKLWSQGEKMQVGPLDTSLVGFVPPTLSPEQAAAHTWRPDAKTWEEIKKRSADQPATVIVTGYASEKDSQPLTHAQAAIQTSKDPVGAPIFYRDVPLLPPPPESEQRGVIKPLPDSVLPKIKWRLRYINDTESKTVMEGLPTCANCHSISRDGKTLGIDVDGPQNDKGLYALIPIEKFSSIANKYVIRWSAYTETGSPKRFGFMSQVSKNGQYVVTSIEVPGTRGQRVTDRIYQGLYDFWGFGQVFYPTRGVLAWYSKATEKLQQLPGANDSEYVQTCAFWSPDESFIVFCRAKARDPYPPGQPASRFANDPNETQIQYDLYRIRS